MSLCVTYSTIPPASNLYSRLQCEKAFGILMVNLFTYSCGIFRFFEINPFEINEILKEVIEKYQETFGSKLEASQIIGEFRYEIRRTRQIYQGIEDRTVLLERTCSGIADRLSKELSKRQVAHCGFWKRLPVLRSVGMSFPPR